MSQEAPIRADAIAYLRRGWSVIPLQPRGKRPLVRWQEYQRRPPDEEEVEAWFDRWPDANVGVVTGSVSGLVVLDADPRHGALPTLAEAEREHGPMPRTIEALSGGGGRHVYFAAPSRPLRNQVGLAPGLDLRAEGGLIVAPPSLHPSGAPYLWRPGHEPGSTSLAPMPAWVLALAGAEALGRSHPILHWRHLVHEGVEEGARNNTIASFAGRLLWHGVDPEVVLELLLCWNRVRSRPPLDDDEVIRTVTSIARLHQAGDEEPRS